MVTTAVYDFHSTESRDTLSPSSAQQRCPTAGKVTVGLGMRHKLQWFIHLRDQGISQGDEDLAYTPRGAWRSLYLYLTVDSEHLLLPARLGTRSIEFRLVLSRVRTALSEATQGRCPKIRGERPSCSRDRCASAVAARCRNNFGLVWARPAKEQPSFVQLAAV